MDSIVESIQKHKADAIDYLLINKDGTFNLTHNLTTESFRTGGNNYLPKLGYSLY